MTSAQAHFVSSWEAQHSCLAVEAQHSCLAVQGVFERPHRAGSQICTGLPACFAAMALGWVMAPVVLGQVTAHEVELYSVKPQQQALVKHQELFAAAGWECVVLLLPMAF